MLGGLATYFECQDIKRWEILLGPELLKSIPLVLLCLLTPIYLLKNNIQYQETNRFKDFTPSLTGLFFLILVFGHKIIRSNLDSSPTLFTAINYDIGNDGGFTLDFKKNNHLTGKRIDHFSETSYWGNYIKRGDTLFLNIPLDFAMGKHAILNDNTLCFIDDTVHFSVFKP